MMNTHVTKSLGIALAILFVSSQFTYAGEPAFEDTMPNHDAAPEKVTRFFVGIDMGSTALATVTAGESKKSGYQFDVKGSYGFYLEKWVFDFGAGYFSNNMSSSANHLRVITNGALVAVDPQYRLLPQWQFGPALNLLIGNDVSFSESEPGADSKNFNLMGGLSTKYEIPFAGHSVRLVAQALTTITETQRLLWVFQGGVQFGFPITGDFK